ncbi:energy transducer TonB [Pedomonas mirosovicensis]|uniref:energy transducer TonB n=1 Tax=Pedomonas mirosovicensis TaxID=2908641 RepID=UPI002169BB03|nr:energy transducer TonB [Pedomonas mirosovicensis]MCH8684696.1 energy transducer TonB [Pedomonas mirosovicensis]
MAYTDQQMSKGRIGALSVVIVIHIMLGWAFSAGLAPKFIKLIQGPIEVTEIEEAPPPEDEPPPPPPELEEIPPYVPPPDLPIELPPPPAPPPITSQTTVKQVEPQRVTQPAPPTPAVAPKPVNRVPAKGSRRNVISEDDYPSASLRAEEEGVTRVRFTINTEGRVSQCSVVESSGHPRLDEKTCDLIQRRFRFDPATADGKPVEETRTQSVKWQIRR